MASNGVPSIAVEGGDNGVVMNTSSSGNVSLEFVLSPARNVASPRAQKFQSPARAASPASLDDITAKLKTAEGNRERLLDEKVYKMKEHDKRIAEVRQSVLDKSEQNRANLEVSRQKIAYAEELRQQRLENLVEKLKQHDNHIEEVRKRLANKGEKNGEALQQELVDATASRNLVAEAIQEKQQNGVQNGNAKENLNP